mgnify:CR=1 FL=1
MIAIFELEALQVFRVEQDHVAAFDELVARRVQVIEGDVGTDGLGLSPQDREILHSCDIVMHSAATVSFDVLSPSR